VQLHDANVAHHVRAIACHPGVGGVRIVRSAPVPALTDPKIRFEMVPASPKWKRFSALYRRCRQLVREGAVDAVLSFNPIPYGLIAAAAARGRVPYHLGFIGSDLHGWRQVQTWRLLRPVLRHASFVTVTGARMREECQRFGSLPDRTVILPHTLEVDQFPPGDPAQADYEFIFIGNLIPLKRVDLILQAFAEVRRRHPAARLCVVGDGPSRVSLQGLARKLSIQEAVEFTGYQRDVASYLRRARNLVLASESEGLPFVLVEGACCGVVPVCTRVGTIDEMVVDGENGLLVPPRDGRALASAMSRLLDDPELAGRMRERLLRERSTHHDHHATAVWDRWFAQLASPPVS
jgi:glycosyltransferase involved in cell wall biosynthesis